MIRGPCLTVPVIRAKVTKIAASGLLLALSGRELWFSGGVL